MTVQNSEARRRTLGQKGAIELASLVACRIWRTWHTVGTPLTGLVAAVHDPTTHRGIDKVWSEISSRERTMVQLSLAT